MKYKKLTVYQTQMARRLIKFEHYSAADAAGMLGLNPQELTVYFEKHKMRDYTDQEQIFKKKALISVQNRIRTENLRQQLHIGMYLKYEEAPSLEHKKGLRRRGDVFYVDEIKVGIIRPNFRKEFFTFNDLMCSNVTFTIYNNRGEYDNGQNPG